MAFGDEFKVNTTVSGSQGNSSAAQLSDGGYIVVWQSPNQNGDGSGIFGQKFTSSGAPNGSEFLINTHTAKEQIGAHVSALEDGRFVVTWSSEGQDVPSTNGYGVFAQIFDAAGAHEGGEFLVNTFTNGRQIVGSIASLANGGFVITWYSSGGSTQDEDSVGVFAQVYDPTGTPIGTGFLVNTHTIGTQKSASVVGLSDGRFVITWNSYAQDGSQDGIFGQILSASGAKIGDEFQVNTYTTSSQQYSQVNSLADGGFVVTWESYKQDGDLNGIYAHIYNSNGSSQTGEFKVNATTDGNQNSTSVAGLEDGSLIFTWTSGGEIVAQKVDSAGKAIGDEFQINTYETNTQGASDVIDAGNGNVFVVWSSSGQDGSSSGVYAKIITQSDDTPVIDLSVATYQSLQIGDAKAWHNGDGTVTYSYLDTEMPDYYSEVDVLQNRGGNADSSPDGWAIEFKQVGEPLAVVSFSASFEVTDGQLVAIDQAIKLWNEIANVNLVLGTVAGKSYGDITFGSYYGRTEDGTNNTAPTIGAVGEPNDFPAGFANFPDPSALGGNVQSGDVWFNNAAADIIPATYGGFGFSTILHEIGHAIGLSHPNDAPLNADTEFNSEQYTLMSYLPHPNSDLDGNPVAEDNISYAVTPLLIDIQAIQNLYGANQNTRIGDNTYFGNGAGSSYKIEDGKTKIVAVWDALGIDTFDASNQSNYVVINLNPGAFSSIGSIQNNIVIASGFDNNGKQIPNAESAWIENATGGAGNDTITGNILGNILLGGGGDDEFAGGGGLDTIDGGNGIDTVKFKGYQSEYTIVEGQNFVTTVQDTVINRDGTINITNVEFLQFTDGKIAVNAPVAIDWKTDAPSIEVSAASYQFFTGGAPSEAGFKFLISSTDNPADLNDVYYTQFNTENRFINFANNLGAVGEGKEAFTQKFGSLTFNQTIKIAFEEIIGSQAITDSGGDPQKSLEFFYNAEAFYTAVANERVVPSGIDLDLAVKVVAVGSILNEAMKGNIGLYSDAIDVLANDVATTGTSALFGHDLFG